GGAVVGGLAPTARQQCRQGRGQANGRTILHVGAVEAAQQGQDGLGRCQTALQGFLQDRPEKGESLGSEALVEALTRQLQVERLGDVAEVAQGRLGVIEPTEGEGLQEGRAGDLALPLDEAGVPGGLIGKAVEQGLEGIGQVCYRSHEEKLRGEGVAVTNNHPSTGASSCVTTLLT